MLLPALLLPAYCDGSAQASAQSPTYGLGKTPSEEEIRAEDIAISPTGKELPPGQGTRRRAPTSMPIVVRHATAPQGYGGRAPALIKGSRRRLAALGMKSGDVMATHSPYATTIWDYINRAMPLYQEGSLKPDEVYALTAFLLFKNGVIQESDVMDQQTLPQVKMPNRGGYSDVPEYHHGQPRIFPNNH